MCVCMYVCMFVHIYMQGSVLGSVQAWVLSKKAAGGGTTRPILNGFHQFLDRFHRFSMVFMNFIDFSIVIL